MDKILDLNGDEGLGFLDKALRDALGEEAGYSAETLSRLASDDGYCEAALRHARRLIRAHAPVVWASLLKSAASGNTTAIRLYFDIFGRDIGDNCGKSCSWSEGDEAAAREIGGLRSELFGGEGGSGESEAGLIGG